MPGDLFAESDDAAREMSRFDAELGGELAPFTSVLLRSESAASSKIERLTASARQIALAELGPAKYGSNAPQIVANTRAMRAALDLADEMSPEAMLAMHRELMLQHDPQEAGRWRTEQVWIGGSDFSPAGADFVPPHHDHVPAAIDDLARFAARHDVPAIPHLAIAHAQFETIHPFTDGNGRTGRALVQAMLRARGLTRNVTMPLSAGLLAHVGDYYRALDAYREGRPEPLVTMFNTSTYRAIDNGRALVGDVRAIREAWDERLTVRRGSRTYDVADLLTRQPVIDSRTLASELGIARGHVRRHMDPLIEAGVVTETKVHRHGITWSALEILHALDDFAERAGKRRAPAGHARAVNDIASDRPAR
ncbi:Fic family protein [Isoptericola croceus]|uniref:Fic family protein n=1 Tax=Isoptericola croceus TaxID=3031406 RepID=UPI0023F67148|nr:Fic family protein [Isoptericola croceus]